MQQKITKHVRVVADLDPSIVEKIDAERAGVCSRAAIVRLALMERYHAPRKSLAKAGKRVA